MKREELNRLLEGLNEHMRTYVSFDHSEGNDAIKKGWFTEEDLLNWVSIDDEDDNINTSPLQEIAESLKKKLETMSAEELDEEYESITHEKFYERWVNKIHSLTPERRAELILKTQAKYESDTYRNKEWALGYEPREELNQLLFKYAIKYGEDIWEKSEKAGYCLDFCNGLFLVDNNFIVELICGQGSMVNVFTVESYNKLKKN